MTEATNDPLSGLWMPTQLQALFYGSGSVQKHLKSQLPSANSKAFIITGSSLANKTTLVKEVEEILGKEHWAGTFSDIKQHSPVEQLDRATEAVSADHSIDTIVSIGGGSPIDAAKAISYRVNEKSGSFLHHITVPTTLSAAECTMGAGYTGRDGVKTGVKHPKLAPQVIIYDSKFAKETPSHLLLSTAIRSLDHSMETMYHGTASEIARQMALQAASSLFIYLPKYKLDPADENVITQLQLAAFSSLGFMGLNLQGPLGLSHTLGYALGSPYGIPHGVTSCLTLGHVVKLMASKPQAAAQIARMMPFLGRARSGNDEADAVEVGDAVLELVKGLDLATDLKTLGVGDDQVPIIVKRATGGLTEGPLYDKVTELVKNLY